MKYKLSDVSTYNMNNLKKNYSDPIKYIDTGAVTDGKFNDPMVYNGIGEAPSRARRIAEVGDTVISTVRPENRHVGFVDEINAYNTYSTGFMIIHPNRTLVDPYYLYMVLSSWKITKKLQSIAGGSTSTYPSFKPSDLNDLIWDFPEINKQKEYAQKIKLVDRKISLNSMINDNLFELILNNFYKVPLEKTINIENIANVSSSTRIFAHEYTDSGVPFYRGKEISQLSKSIILKPSLFISNQRFLALNDIPKPGDILITSVGTIGNLYEVKERDSPFYFKDGNITRIHATNEKYNDYIFFWLNSKYGKREIQQSLIGSTQKALTIKSIKNFKISVPSKVNLKRFNAFVGPIEEKIDANKAQSKYLNEIKLNMTSKFLSN